MKELAVTALRNIRGSTPPDATLAQSSVALAAAAIALVERLDQIVGILQAETGYGPVECDGPARQ
jgi:hypothetical protein